MGPTPPRPGFDIRRIAVIGAGPCGLSAVKYLLAQQAFESITIFEQQAEVGGVWYYRDEARETRHVPQTSVQCPPEPPIRPAAGCPPVIPTPMYELLHTNIPRQLMKYSDLSFPDGGTVFPSRETVQKYLVGYAREIWHLIAFSTQVTDVRLRREGGRDRWDVDTRSLTTEAETTVTFDALVVASGHYSVTYIPDVPNIAAFHAAHPTVISHTKYYRKPDLYAGKKVLIVGNAASGLDIASQISRVCRKPLLLSVQTATPAAQLAHVDADEFPVITEFLVPQRAVKFVDGRVEDGLDAILFATGYLYTFPFLTSLKPPLVTNGRRVHGLYKELFHIQHPTLVFPGLPIKIIPFPVSESQASVFSRVWANELSLPGLEEMREWEADEAEDRGVAFHVWSQGGDVQYVNYVHDWLAKSGTSGKLPPYWNEERVWERRICHEAKLRFESQGRNARSLKELGLEYRPGQASEGAMDML